MNLRHLLLIALTSLLVAGCATDEALKEKSEAEKQYDAAKEKINKGQYSAAAFDLEKFSANFPYSNYASKGELLRIFAAYKASEYVLTETLTESFVERHPTHPHIDYAKYMLALSHFMQRGNKNHDTTHNKLAIEGFQKLLKEHPNSQYAKDGASKLQILYDSIAAHELEVGKYYFDRDRFVAAANRFTKVVSEYQTTAAIEEALYYLAASYIEMDQQQQAARMVKLLQHNYPGSDWSRKANALL